MEALQSYGIYLIVLGVLLIVAGMVMGYLTILPSPTNAIDLPGEIVGPQPPQFVQKVDVVVKPNEVVRTNVLEDVANSTNAVPNNSDNSVATTNSQTTGTIDIASMEQIMRFADLLERGVITKEEFDAFKQSILAKPAE